MKYEFLARLAHNGIVQIPEAQLRTGNPPGLNFEKGFDMGSQFAQRDPQSPPTLQLLRKDNGPGLWVPYLAQTNVYAYVSNMHFWAASGPFSGCVFEVGEHNGRKYVAHLSRETKVDPNIGAWNEGFANRRVLFTKVIKYDEPNVMHFRTDRPNQLGACAAIAIVNLSGQISVTQLDLRTNTADSLSGRVMSVKRLSTD